MNKVYELWQFEKDWETRFKKFDSKLANCDPDLGEYDSIEYFFTNPILPLKINSEIVSKT